MSYAAPETKTSGVAIASLVCGVLSICPSCLANIAAVVLGFMAISQINSSNGALKGKGLATTGIVLGIVTIVLHVIIGYFLIEAGREAARTAALSLRTMNNMRQIGLATLNFESRFRHLPRAGRHTNELPHKLSWRVHLLPFMEHQALFHKFKLDEPWDSDHNKPLLAEMPEFYHALHSKLDRSSGKTCYQFAVGPGTIFDTEEPLSLAGIRDGSSNTVLLVMTDDEHAVPWTSPEDYDVAQAPRGLADWRGNTFFLFFDGSVHSHQLSTIPADYWRAVFTHAGGEPVLPLD